MNLPPDTWLLLGSIAIALVAALVATIGYALFVERRRTNRILKLTQSLVSSPGNTGELRTDTLRDPRLRSAFDQLVERVGETWAMATTDLLTAVLNRQALMARLDEELRRAGRYDRPVSIILLDLDHFKRVNDSYGHAGGDAVLQAVAQTLRSSVRTVDAVGRYGGEEFMLVLPETDVDTAATLAEKLRQIVAGRKIRLPDGHVVEVTMSAGVAGGPGSLLQLSTLVRDADAALYSAKALGRDQVFVFREIAEDGMILRAPIPPEARQHAVEIGRAAAGAATAVLTAELESLPGWAGRPSMLIAETAAAVGQALGLPSGELERIRVASLLHDLGKLAIPNEILAKQGALGEPEWRVMAEHPKIGQVVLEQAGALRDAATIVLHHHEWFNGKGYPHGLAGEDIPVGSRIVAIADAYEAMIGGRPYKEPIGHDAALEELRRQAGVQFDPDMVSVFADLFRDGVPWPIQAGPASPPGGRRSRGDRTSEATSRRSRREAATPPAPNGTTG